MFLWDINLRKTKYIFLTPEGELHKSWVLSALKILRLCMTKTYFSWKHNSNDKETSSPNFKAVVNTSKKLWKYKLNFSRSSLFYVKTGICLKYFRHDCSIF